MFAQLRKINPSLQEKEGILSSKSTHSWFAPFHRAFYELGDDLWTVNCQIVPHPSRCNGGCDDCLFERVVVFGKQHVRQPVLSCTVLISREWECSWGLLKESGAPCSGLRKAAEAYPW